MKFPKKVYVKIESERSGGTKYLVANPDMFAMVEMGEKTKVATYELNQMLKETTRG